MYNFNWQPGCETTQMILESYDDMLAASRDTRQYRDKGGRKTSIKTVYGEVEYRRRVYRTSLEDGEKAYVYLLDEAMGMDKIGLISTNLAEKTAMTVTESPCRVAAEAISSTCGQGISAGGAWNMMQRLGERISGVEDHAVRQMNAGRLEGTKEIPVLFEEMDGVWLPMQDGHHKKMKRQEMKVFTMYEGWDAEAEKQNRSTLVGKRMLVGMEKSGEFHEKREACIRKEYNADEIWQRILNGDGESLPGGLLLREGGQRLEMKRQDLEVLYLLLEVYERTYGGRVVSEIKKEITARYRGATGENISGKRNPLGGREEKPVYRRRKTTDQGTAGQGDVDPRNSRRNRMLCRICAGCIE